MNFKHLHYFWVTAKAGGVVRAGEQLHITPQTLSSQIKLLEDRLGQRLFKKAGRSLELTAQGKVALAYAEEIFNLGHELEGAVRRARSQAPVLDFRVGVADSVAKSVAYRLLEPAMGLKQRVHLICSEGKLTDLLGQLALHRLDLVLADEPLSRRLNIKAFNHPLGRSSMSFFGAPALRASLKGRFPQCLDDAPMLLPGAAASVRQQWDAWVERHRIAPRVLAEFDDGALMNAFGRAGQGVFMGPAVFEEEICQQLGVELLGRAPELFEEFYAISVERRITHPGVAAITEAARGRLGPAEAPGSSAQGVSPPFPVRAPD